MAKRNFFGKKQPDSNPQPENESLNTEANSSKLIFKTFRFNEQQAVCDWVNNNNIDLATIATDGNRISVFYWENNNSILQ